MKQIQPILFLLAGAFIAIALFSFKKEEPISNKETSIEYCHLTIGVLSEATLEIVTDKEYKQEILPRDKSKFPSVLAKINQMSKDGWKLIKYERLSSTAREYTLERVR